MGALLKNKPGLYDDTDKALAKTMSALWVQFAKTGNPNRTGLPFWPHYQAAKDEYLEFGDTVEVKSHLRTAQLEALGRHFAALKAERAK
jgi:para-nitrobenzyl esterase